MTCGYNETRKDVWMEGGGFCDVMVRVAREGAVCTTPELGLWPVPSARLLLSSQPLHSRYSERKPECGVSSE